MTSCAALRCRSSVLMLALLLGVGMIPNAAQAPKSDAQKPTGPTDPKAQKTFANAIDWEKKRDGESAVDDFLKANKQDGGKCLECVKRAYTLALTINKFKEAEEAAREWLLLVQTDAEKAAVHYRLAVALQRQGTIDKKEKCFAESCDEFKSALQLAPRFPSAHYSMGVSLAHLHQDDAARAEFSTFVEQDKDSPDMRDRAHRYLDRIELARATMVPPFSVTTIDGKHVSMDNLTGKVVLIDFWATWCGPCRQALPHVKKIASKYASEPLVVLSVSLDQDEGKWKEFVTKNEMTWLQYRDGGFNGTLAKQFGVTAIPSTFSIDADGVLQDEHVGDGDIDGRLEKLIKQAKKRMATETASSAVGKSPGAAE